MLMNWTMPMERILDEWLAPEPTVKPGSMVPAADVTDDGEVFRIVMELPGVAKEGLEIELKDEVLRIRGQRPAPSEKEKMLVDGRHASRVFERQFTLGREIDREQVNARLENGLLTLVLPRRAEVKPQRIQVETA
jgi:HSP20 family molecular chaperone IbpA